MIMGKYEEALENCDQAVQLRLANDSVVSVDDSRSVIQISLAK